MRPKIGSSDAKPTVRPAIFAAPPATTATHLSKCQTANCAPRTARCAGGFHRWPSQDKRGERSAERRTHSWVPHLAGCSAGFGETRSPSGAPLAAISVFEAALRGCSAPSSLPGLGHPPLSGGPGRRENFERPLSWLPAPDRSVRRRGPEASRVRDCESRPRAPHLPSRAFFPEAGHQICRDIAAASPPVRPAFTTPRESAPRWTRQHIPSRD